MTLEPREVALAATIDWDIAAFASPTGRTRLFGLDAEGVPRPPDGDGHGEAGLEVDV